MIPHSLDELRTTVYGLLATGEEEQPQDNDNLLDYGVNSLQIMELAAAWSTSSADIHFMELAQTPTIAGWWALLEGHNA